MHKLPELKNMTAQATRAYPVLALGLLLSACSGTPPTDLGVHGGHLRDCPPSPNCVSSQATDSEHQIAPLPLSDDPAQTRARLLTLLASLPQAKLVAQQDNYLRAEFTSQIMGFVDDVEFLLGPQAIEVRSASRLGRSDFGVNRERVEQLRQQLSRPE
ncbi:MAG: DUF1499 domain-containing protein [Pseudomonas sp.]|uniref:DUF1499 domain-containing protein n=1 Tax=Pseudomonas sp. TaxID=306 RepID=UPI002734C4B8|nr:DUF1499 domain-containing protein [Pseudomonas sp.]MDP3845481.1 DUF1499 domain-containing protein [Pseudomonas sp.]